MSALIQLLQRGGLLVGGALVIGLLNLVYDGEQWAKSGATPLFSMMLRYLVPLLAGIWLIVLGAFTSDIVLDGYVQALKKLGRESVCCRYLTKSLSAILDDEKDIGTWADINSRAFDGEWRRVNLFQDHLSKEQA